MAIQSSLTVAAQIGNPGSQMGVAGGVAGLNNYTCSEVTIFAALQHAGGKWSEFNWKCNPIGTHQKGEWP